jgi:hypothetical protein
MGCPVKELEESLLIQGTICKSRRRLPVKLATTACSNHLGEEVQQPSQSSI